MSKKINTISFILLLFLLLGVASAADCDNETLKQKIEHVNNETHQTSFENTGKLEASNSNTEKVGLSVGNTNILQATKKTTYNSLLPATSDSKLKVNIKAPNVKMYYKDGSKFSVTVKTQANKAIKNVKVKIAINGNTYTKTTDSKGKASISLNLNSGKYGVVTTFDGTKTYAKKSVKSTVTIKSTIHCNDMAKYYKNKAAYYSKFYNQKGKLLKETSVKFKLNGHVHSVKTTKKGVGKLAVDLKPGTYSISSINSKTSETVTKTITIRTILETHDLTMNEYDGSKFSVKVLSSKGKASPNKKVTMNVNGRTYTPKSNANGIAEQAIDLPAGTYAITTEYGGLINTNLITVNKNPEIVVEAPIKKTGYVHTTMIPNYVNVTTPYVFHNSAYALETGIDGIIRMPKNDIYTIQISETKGYLFSHDKIDGVDSIIIGYKTHLVPFDDSGIQSDINKDNLKGDGILISSGVNYTQIEYRSTTEVNTELFGVYLDEGLQHSETITYLQNNRIRAMVNFYTYNYDELGLKYNLAKFYGKTIYDFNYKSYDEITQNNAKSIKFANTNEPVTLSYFGNSIVGPVSKEGIVTKFTVNGKEELEKKEIISYGLGEKYKPQNGFEVLQSYAIINEKMTANILEKWMDESTAYLIRYGIKNVYSMFLASLQTAWFADIVADYYAGDFDVNWNRENTLTILGGINLDDTYINILNADMGMGVSGNRENVESFKLFNSLILPNIEDYGLESASITYRNVTSNSLDNVFNSIARNNYSVAQLGEMIYVFGGDDSAIILNVTSGVSSVIISKSGSVYKGAVINSKDDCCSICNLANYMFNRIKNNVDAFKSNVDGVLDKLKNLYPLTMMAYQGIKFALPHFLSGASSVALGLFNIMTIVQNIGVNYRTSYVDEKDWHTVMDFATFTRSSYLQYKKVYNIPNNKGGSDYLEVPIKGDFTLDRNKAIYISSGETRNLTKEETYNYFTEDYWTPFSMPTKYWDKSWK